MFPLFLKLNLELVVERELKTPLFVANAVDYAEIAVLNSVVRISVVSHVQEVEEVRTEAKRLLMKDVEVLEQRRVELIETGGALRAVGPCPEHVRGWLTIRANAGLNAASVGARGCCGIGAEPMVERPIDDVKVGILISACAAVGTGVAAVGYDRYRRASKRLEGVGKRPAAQSFLEEDVRGRAEAPSVAVRQSVYNNCIELVTDVVA